VVSCAFNMPEIHPSAFHPFHRVRGKLGYPLGPGEKPSFNNDLLRPGSGMAAFVAGYANMSYG